MPKVLIISSCGTSIKLPIRVEVSKHRKRGNVQVYMEKFEPFYMMPCKLSIVNVWQKVLT